MVSKSDAVLQDLYARYSPLRVCQEEISRAVQTLVEMHQNGKKVLVCGNGGSAADSEHIVGELMKGFLLARPLPESTKTKLQERFGNDGEQLGKMLQESVQAISLVSQCALMTAFGNDQGAQGAFAQQVYGYGRPGDVLIAISTSGNSQNIIYAAQMAKYCEMTVILLSGESGGKLKDICDINICAPAKETYKIQEYHLPIYHCLCAAVENELFGA